MVQALYKALRQALSRDLTILPREGYASVSNDVFRILGDVANSGGLRSVFSGTGKVMSATDSISRSKDDNPENRVRRRMLNRAYNYGRQQARKLLGQGEDY